MTLVAAVLRALWLGNQGLWYDELIMARVTAGDLGSVWQEVLRGRPAVYTYLAWVWCGVAGTTDEAMRAFSALIGAATVPVLYAVGRRLFDPKVGLLAAVLCAVSPYQVYYSQEHRYYALLLLTATASVWFLLRALDWHRGRGRSREAEAGSGPRWAWGYVASSLLMFYTHPLSACLLISMGVGVLGLGTRGGLTAAALKRFFWAQAAIVAGCVPWLTVLIASRFGGGPEAAQAAASFVPWIQLPPWWAPVRTAVNFVVRGQRFVRADAAVLGAAVLLAGLVWAALRRGAAKRSERRGAAKCSERRGGPERPDSARWHPWWLAACWAGGSIAIVAGLSWAAKPVYVDRYVIAASAGQYVLMAAALVAVRRVLPVWAGAGALVLVMSGALVSYYQNPQKGAWREATAWLDGQIQARDVLVFASERGDAKETRHVRKNWFWYARKSGVQQPRDICIQDGVRVVARRLARAISDGSAGHTLPAGGLPEVMAPGLAADAGVWLVMWRDADRPVGLAEAFAAGPVEGLRLDKSRSFFDLMLLRFVRNLNESV